MSTTEDRKWIASPFTRGWQEMIHEHIPGCEPEEEELVDTFSRALAQCEGVFCERQRKYGSRNIADSPGGAFYGVVVRMHDKMARIRNYVEGDHTEYDDESIHDTLIDIANYATIARLVLSGGWPKK